MHRMNAKSPDNDKNHYGVSFDPRTMVAFYTLLDLTVTLIQIIERYIRYYNTRRVQRNLGILTPMEKHELYLAA